MAESLTQKSNNLFSPPAGSRLSEQTGERRLGGLGCIPVPFFTALMVRSMTAVVRIALEGGCVAMAPVYDKAEVETEYWCGMT